MATSSNTNTWVTSERSLALTQSIQFIRASNVECTVRGARPNTRLYIFFDGVSINQYCGPIPLTGGSSTVVGTAPNANVPINVPVVTNANGVAKFLFKIPGNTFNTGEKDIIVSDVADMSLLAIPGTVYGSARSKYTTKGTLETYQRITTTHNHETVNIVNVTQVTQVGRQDPLAQSFFTYGVKGGIFLTGIEVFFLSKDTTGVPIRCELRGMSIGMPLELNTSNPDLVSTLPAELVNTCTPQQLKDGTAKGTKFKFNPPVYLKEDGDFCFVLFTNSKSYHVYTSKLGEVSYETGYGIMENPYNGSMFKSENNYTWTPEQTEDIKFNIYRAKFNTTTAGVAKFAADQSTMIISTKQFSTTSGSNFVTYRTITKHGLQNGDKVYIEADRRGTYNGITGSQFSGSWSVDTVVDEYNVKFAVGGTANKTGEIFTGGFINSIQIENPGSGYGSAPTLSFSGSSTTAASASCIVENGKIKAIAWAANDTSHGVGYASAPSILVSGTGTGAVLTAVIDSVFNVATNSPYSLISPQIKAAQIASSTLTSTVDVMDNDYVRAERKPFVHSNYVVFEQERLLASRANEAARFASGNSLEVAMTMTTDNDNVSPIIDMRTPPTLILGSYKLNDQANIENIASTVASGSVAITITTPGSGYSTLPTVTVVNSLNDKTGTGAVITPTRVGDTITFVVTNVGTGYTQIPSVLVSGGGGTGASVQLKLTDFNSEIGGKTGVPGTAKSRYLTKKVTLTSVSSSIRLFALIDSSTETDVDVYIRTSFTGANELHTDSKWQLLTCDTERHKSGVKGDYYEYEFYKEDMTGFDVYDLKFVMSSTNVARAPCIGNYRVIISV